MSSDPSQIIMPIPLRIETQIFSLHWMMQYIRLFYLCVAQRASLRHLGFTDIKKPNVLHHPVQAKNLHFSPYLFISSGFYRTQYPVSYTHKSLGRTPQFTLPASTGTQTYLLCLSLKSQIPKLFRNDSVFPIITAYL